jgi:RNA-directed DNA polymerase
MSAENPFATRRYIHFDEPIGEDASRLLATDPERVAKWPFMPMLKCVISVRKVKRSKGGILEKKFKDRPICYSSHKDAAIYAYYSNILNNAYEARLKEAGLDSIVTAFRQDAGKCNIHFAKEAFNWIRSHGECVALAFDIKSFFDNLDHAVLKQQWKSVLGAKSLSKDHYAVFKSLTQFAYVNRMDAFAALGISRHNPRANRRKRLCSPEEFRTKIRDAGLVKTNPDCFGIPQGSPMSATLSNIYMMEFDTAVNAKVMSVGGLYRRYCDDMLCIVPNQFEKEVEAFVMDEIKKVKLVIQEAKTMRHHFQTSGGIAAGDKALQYLGFLFDGNRVLLRNAGLGKFYSKMRAGVRMASACKRKADKKNSGADASKNPIKRKQLNVRYSYRGKQNYVSYALRAAEEFNEPAIKKQIRRHWKKLNAIVSKADNKFTGA